MGVKEIVLLTVAQQALQAVGSFAKQAGAATANPVGQIAYAEASKFAQNMATLAGLGLNAATAEFAATNKAEKDFVAAAALLPPVT